MGSRLKDRHRRHDRFYRQAKDEQFAARSVYKLKEINERFRLLRPGRRVLDLGCRPGSWMQYAASIVGPKGTVVGVDRTPLDIELGDNMRVVVGDVTTLPLNEIRGDVPCFHVVLSDMAPDTSGVGFADRVRSIDLMLCAHDLALKLGCPGSAFVAKVFMGSGFDEAVAMLRRSYERVTTVKPAASRKESTELYVIGVGKRQSDRCPKQKSDEET